MASVDANSILSSFASNYVRSVVGNEVKRKEVLECLERDEPHVDTAFAAIVIIDVSGYSRITSQLAEHGRVSSELVTLALCDYFNQIIGVIESHGGDVVKFLGDAVLAVFRNTPPETKPQDTAVTDSSSTLSDTLPDFSTITRKASLEGCNIYISKKKDISGRVYDVERIKADLRVFDNTKPEFIHFYARIPVPPLSLKHSSIQRLLLQASNGSAGTAPMYPKPGAIALGSEDEAHMISGGLLMSGNADLQHHEEVGFCGAWRVFKDLGELLESASQWNQVFPNVQAFADGTAISRSVFRVSLTCTNLSFKLEACSPVWSSWYCTGMLLCSDIYRIISPSQLQRKDTSKTKTSVDEDPGAVMGKAREALS
ncbi:hypothetical protein BC829DRAFT_416815 [Chytridium lagenaria]|nr:hypothetical protein BC829DRAFT_416815 [Chytridium lagenaria]